MGAPPLPVTVHFDARPQQSTLPHHKPRTSSHQPRALDVDSLWDTHDVENEDEASTPINIHINASLMIKGSNNVVTFAPAAAALYLQRSLKDIFDQRLDGGLDIEVDASVTIDGDRNVVGGAAAALLLQRPAKGSDVERVGASAVSKRGRDEGNLFVDDRKVKREKPSQDILDLAE